IALNHKPGAEVIICSDGRVFNDLVFVSENDLNQYDDQIKNIIRDFNLSNLKTYSLDDFYSTDAKEKLIANFAPDLNELKVAIKSIPSDLHMFNGVHRVSKYSMAFMSLYESRNQLSRQAEEIANQAIRRSR